MSPKSDVRFSLSKRFHNGIFVGLVLFWVTMFILTHLPKVPSSVTQMGDKTAHFVGYGVLLFGCCLSSASRDNFGLQNALKWNLVVSLYAAFDELTQPIVGRDADLNDWVADTLGGLAGTALFFLLRSLTHRLWPGGRAPVSTRTDLH